MLNSYLKRIGYEGPQKPTLEVLGNIHRQHVLGIAYENIDVLLQRPVDRSIEHIHQKLVVEQRGGWCYEMNGLLGWALTELGFNVTQLSGGVMRKEHGDAAYGNHLLLRIDFDANADSTNQSWLADVGLGDGLLEPIPLDVGSYQQNNATFSLVKLDEPTSAQSWRFVNHEGGLPPSFDFINQTANQAELDGTCATLQSDDKSIFRQNLVVQRVTDQGVQSLVGRLYTAANGQRQVVKSEQALSLLLTQAFGITQPPMTGLWNAVCHRHTELFADKPDGDFEVAGRAS